MNTVPLLLFVVMNMTGSAVLAQDSAGQSREILLRMQIQPVTESLDAQRAKAFYHRFVAKKIGDGNHQIYQNLIKKLQENTDYNKKARLLMRRVEVIYSFKGEQPSYDFEKMDYPSGNRTKNYDTASSELITRLEDLNLASVESHKNWRGDDVDDSRRLKVKIKISAKNFLEAQRVIQEADGSVYADVDGFLKEIKDLERQRSQVIAQRIAELVHGRNFCEIKEADSGPTKDRWSVIWSPKDTRHDQTSTNYIVTGLASAAAAKKIASEREICRFDSLPLLGRCALERGNDNWKNWDFILRPSDADTRASYSQEYDTPEMVMVAMANYKPCFDEEGYWKFLELRGIHE